MEINIQRPGIPVEKYRYTYMEVEIKFTLFIKHIFNRHHTDQSALQYV